MSDETYAALWYVVGVAGFLLALGLTAAVILLVRKPLAQFLARIVRDEKVANMGATFVLVLLALRGLEGILDSINQTHLNFLFGKITGMLAGMANDIQWVIYIAALLFIGYSLQGWRGPGPGE